MRLKDKVAVVTGAAGGIGLACAQAFIKEGAKVILSDRRCGARRRRGEEAGQQCGVRRLRRGRCEAGPGADRHGREGLRAHRHLRQQRRHHPHRRIPRPRRGRFRPRAARQPQGRVPDRPGGGAPDGEAGQAASRGGYAIINMSSCNAVLAIPNQVPYVVSKGGVNQLTKVMGLSLADKGIRVNAIGPGTIATELARNAVLGSEESRAQDHGAHAARPPRRGRGGRVGRRVPRQRRRRPTSPARPSIPTAAASR